MISLKHIQVGFDLGDGSRFQALSGIDLTIAEGEFITLVGTNGAGKSTLLNVLAGTVAPQKGKLLVDGNDVTNSDDFRRAAWLSRVFPDPRLGTCDLLTVEENLAIALSKTRPRRLGRPLKPTDRDMLRDRLAELSLGLEDRMSTQARLLSSGQRQSLTVIMATLGHPRLLLLDEHVANLDPRTAEKVLSLTDRTVRRQKLASVMVTHDVRHALTYGDRLLALKAGRVVLDVAGRDKAALELADIDQVYGDEGIAAEA
ncbi:MAG: ATP-binding cassette domain-containing protein [Pseudomonadota bacterium]